MVYTEDQAIDILYGTFQEVRKNSVPMGYLYSSYRALNDIWKGKSTLESGKEIERYMALRDEGNAKHASNWAEDTKNIKNITEKYKVQWRRATSNLSWNTIEESLNQGAAAIFNVAKLKYNSMLREVCDKVFQAMWSAPTSSADKDSPLGIPAWITLGEDGSAGGWTAYQSRYNDSSTPGTAYNLAGVECSSTVNPRFASYYADHGGDLDDSLFDMLAEAMRKLNFEPPTILATGDNPALNNKFGVYTTNNVIKQVGRVLAKSDDQMGIRINQHYGTVVFGGAEFVYVPILDTNDAQLYGTDPIYGINHQILHPVVHSDWQFKVGKPVQEPDRHVVFTTPLDLVYNYILEDGSRQFAGFLVSRHPSS